MAWSRSISIILPIYRHQSSGSPTRIAISPLTPPLVIIPTIGHALPTVSLHVITPVEGTNNARRHQNVFIAGHRHGSSPISRLVVNNNASGHLPLNTTPALLALMATFLPSASYFYQSGHQNQYASSYRSSRWLSAPSGTRHQSSF